MTDAAAMNTKPLAPGSRLRCERCGSEAIVTQGGPADLTCCGGPLTVIFDGATRT